MTLLVLLNMKSIGKKEDNQFEVKRIIKAKISADKLVEIRDMLYRALHGTIDTEEDMEGGEDG